MDPAILSLRQFSFPQQLQIAQQHPQHDMFVQNVSQHQQQSNQGKLIKTNKQLCIYFRRYIFHMYM